MQVGFLDRSAAAITTGDLPNPVGAEATLALLVDVIITSNNSSWPERQDENFSGSPSSRGVGILDGQATTNTLTQTIAESQG